MKSGVEAGYGQPADLNDAPRAWIDTQNVIELRRPVTSTKDIDRPP